MKWYNITWQQNVTSHGKICAVHSKAATEKHHKVLEVII